ncbi:MAG: hypothetical protein V1872_07565 [bacterium]
MKAYRTIATIKNPGKVVLSNMPFKSGEKVEIVVIEAEEQKTKAKELKRLFKETQSLPQVKRIKEEDLIKEVKKYRRRK